MKELLRKEHYYYKIYALLMKSSAYLPSKDNPSIWIRPVHKRLGYFGYKNDRTKNLNQKFLSWNLSEPISHIKKWNGGSRTFDTRTHGRHSSFNKNFHILELMMQMKTIIALHVCLFFRQPIHNFSIVLTAFLKKKAKKFEKNCFLY